MFFRSLEILFLTTLPLSHTRQTVFRRCDISGAVLMSVFLQDASKTALRHSTLRERRFNGGSWHMHPEHRSQAFLTMDQFIEKAISVPFVSRGRSFDGWDCFGLVVRAYRDVFGVEIPDYGDRYKDTRDFRSIHELFREGMASWKKVVDDHPEVGDVAVIFRQGRPIHAGIVVVDGRHILHSEELVGTVCEPIYRFRLEGIYRWA